MTISAIIPLVLCLFQFTATTVESGEPTSAMETDSVRVLLVSSTVRDGDLLAEAAAEGVVVVRYDAQQTSLADLVEKVGDALGDRKAASIGIAAHDHGVGRFYLAGRHSICLASTLADREERRFWRELGTLVSPGGRIDILACNLASTEEGMMLVSALADGAGVEVAASSNSTGNLSSGGDWVLETAGIDVEQTYFTSDGLTCFGGLLAAIEQKVVSSDLAVGDTFGGCVSIDDDYAIVGAEQPYGGGMGAAYIFHRSGTTWTQQAKLTASDASSGDLFGYSVSISGEYAIVGAQGYNTGAGCAYIFHRSGTTWSQQTQLTASDAVASDRFGSSLSIDGDYAIVGAPKDQSSGYGSAYIFYRSGTSWSQQAQLSASVSVYQDDFGFSVDIDEDYAVVGSDHYYPGGTGLAFIYHRSGTTWTEQTVLSASDAANGDDFGVSVTIDGDYVIVGADGNELATGSAYVFHRSGSTWTEQAILTANDGAIDDFFGWSVCLDGSFVVIGADGKSFGTGAAYIFQRSATVWNQINQLAASDGHPTAVFGASAALSEGYALISAPKHSIVVTGGGAAYFYSSLPEVIYPVARGIGINSAILGGTVYHSGWSNITARGVVWSRNPSPTLTSNDGSASTSGSLGTFSVRATGLSNGTTYYYRAYATNHRGTAYSDNGTFTTGTPAAPGSLQVTLTPTQARKGGAAWRLSGGSTWYSSGYTLTGLSVGTYTLEFKKINGWTSPESQTATIVSNHLTAIEAEYVKKETSGDLSVTISTPSAVLAGARWRVKSNADASTPPVNFTRWRESGESITLEKGKYIIEFLPVPGWVHMETEVIVKAGEDVEVEATGVPFLISGSTDFDGNGIGDIALFNPTTRLWSIKGGIEKRYGLRGSWPTAGDYDGNGCADFAYWQPKKGIWRVYGQFELKGFGTEGDLPVPGDYDGDGECDPALYRPSTGEWLMALSGDVSVPGKAEVTAVTLGGDAHDIPVPADYDGDGALEAAVYNIGTRVWTIEGADKVRYGRLGELPVPADYDGDGVADLAVVSIADESWRVFYLFTLDIDCAPGVFPLLLDFDGDGIPEPGYYSFEDGSWHVFTFGNEGENYWITETQIDFGDGTVLPLSQGKKSDGCPAGLF